MMCKLGIPSPLTYHSYGHIIYRKLQLTMPSVSNDRQPPGTHNEGSSPCLSQHLVVRGIVFLNKEAPFSYHGPC